MACENFLLLLERGYYDRTPAHRLIKHFMVQMGDPSGTGSGGTSAWGAPFEDEVSQTLGWSPTRSQEWRTFTRFGAHYAFVYVKPS